MSQQTIKIENIANQSNHSFYISGGSDGISPITELHIIPNIPFMKLFQDLEVYFQKEGNATLYQVQNSFYKQETMILNGMNSNI